MKSPARIATEAGPWAVSSIAITVAIAALIIVAAVNFNPVDEVSDQVGEPIAESLGILSGQCPGGWDDESARDDHAIVRSCSRTIDGVRWLVFLDENGDFSHGFATDTPGAEFIFEPGGIPQWR
jgi:hypothetical protein